ncbi:MAG: hypothetical protein ACYDH6_08615 [Acidimicrobiales bacterium]
MPPQQSSPWSWEDWRSLVVIPEAGHGRTMVVMGLPSWPGWALAGVFAEDGAELVLGEVRLYPSPEIWWSVFDPPDGATGHKPGDWSGAEDLPEGPPRAITARMLRDVRVERFAEMARQRIAHVLGRGSAVLQDQRLAAKWAKRAAAADANPARGPKGRGDGYYALWASRYAALQGSRRPIADLAAAYGEAETVSEKRIRDLIHTARERGLLTNRGHGRPGGQLTDKGRAALEPAAQNRRRNTK